MKYTNYKSILGAGAIAMFSIAAMPAFAMTIATPVAVPNNDPIPVKITISATVKADADSKIDARIKTLGDLKVRIDSMQKVSSSEKSSLDANIDSSVSAMAALKTKIDSDTDAATFKADVQSITKSYRIYLLIEPQGRITAASDRVLTIDSLMTDLSAKFQSRISEAQAAGKDVTAVNATLSDYNSKVADSNVQAQAAVNEIANLTPDNGDKSVFTANQQALMDARAKIKVATSDLKTARIDATSIASTLKSWDASVSASSTTTTK